MKNPSNTDPKYLSTCGWCRDLLALRYGKDEVAGDHRVGHLNDSRRHVEEYRRNKKRAQAEVDALVRESEALLARLDKKGAK